MMIMKMYSESTGLLQHKDTYAFYLIYFRKVLKLCAKKSLIFLNINVKSKIQSKRNINIQRK